ncbi:MAG: GGDEF domain-containing protein, partial [Lachnospiraceae bacterium]|nr:GGDEF domain-containing protein [Lachnospiraceae bacterium]
LIFPKLNGDDAVIALEKLRQKIKDIVFDGVFETFTISLTYGLVEYDYHSDMTTILKEADEKLYLGKESGRDRIIF